ncbi:hypothetical protein BURPS1710b_A0674 [Burkholderia pseudomallei 1710b]|uniref:Uncharacterized protein n=1 Tax=Burkholderia pseudomallei (strain 1710b) TaxID=320372 RepID=Q3JKS1_BURP1|nr:hypothetical protein BURPS1710b_A0674 [Burkholderia pseudomallei 1710b]
MQAGQDPQQLHRSLPILASYASLPRSSRSNRANRSRRDAPRRSRRIALPCGQNSSIPPHASFIVRIRRRVCEAPRRSRSRPPRAAAQRLDARDRARELAGRGRPLRVEHEQRQQQVMRARAIAARGGRVAHGAARAVHRVEQQLLHAAPADRRPRPRAQASGEQVRVVVQQRGRDARAGFGVDAPAELEQRVGPQMAQRMLALRAVRERARDVAQHTLRGLGGRPRARRAHARQRRYVRRLAVALVLIALLPAAALAAAMLVALVVRRHVRVRHRRLLARVERLCLAVDAPAPARARRGRLRARLQLGQHLIARGNRVRLIAARIREARVVLAIGRRGARAHRPAPPGIGLRRVKRLRDRARDAAHDGTAADISCCAKCRISAAAHGPAIATVTVTATSFTPYEMLCSCSDVIACRNEIARPEAAATSTTGSEM